MHGKPHSFDEWENVIKQKKAPKRENAKKENKNSWRVNHKKKLSNN